MTGAPILSVAQMQAAEQAMFEAGVGPYALMRRAGEGAAEIIWRAGHKRDALVLCGPGNNGGDGYVIARRLRELDVPVRVAAMGESRTASSKQACAEWDGPVEDMLTTEPATQLIDALFGIGLTRGLSPEIATRLGDLVAAAQYSYAIDVPSGVDSDQAVALSPLPAFTHCIALGAWKPAHVLMPARTFAAQHCLVDIGITPAPDSATMLTAPLLTRPDADAHKYRRGLVAIVAGAMPGAAALSAEAAARSGAGYVRLLCQGDTGALSHAIVRSGALDFDRARCILAGPGIGRDVSAWSRLAAALKSGLPVVADADALWLLAEHGLAGHALPAIATPHEGEFDTLFGGAEDGNKVDITRAAAQRTGIVIVHKGPDTVIAAPDGRCVVAPPASPWLSTAGTGDVLAGLAAGRLALTGDPFRAACEAVWLHSEAARRCGPAFVADDLIAQLRASHVSAL